MVLLLTNNFPPYIGGSSQILYELLRHFPKSYFKVYHGVGSTQKNSTTLSFSVKQIRFLGSLLWTQRMIRYVPLLYSYWLTLYILFFEKKSKIDAIYAHYPSAPFLVTAYFLSKILNKPLIVYYDIIWEGRGMKNEDRLAEKFEKKIVNKASKIITITEHLAKHIEDKYKISCTLLPHTTSKELREKINAKPKKYNTNERFKIHFAGAIYPRMNQDSIERLARVLSKLPFACELELCSPTVPKSISDIFPVTKKYLSHEELLETQINSDLLFLPQAFESDSPKMIELNMPTKAMEYVCTGTPILVHSPKNSYLTWLAYEKGFANIVDTPNDENLRNCIINIYEEKNKQIALVNNAKNFAEERDSKVWADFFDKQIKSCM